MLRVCSNPWAHLDLDFILTQDSCSSQSCSPLDSTIVFHPSLTTPPYIFKSFHGAWGFSEKKTCQITQKSQNDVIYWCEQKTVFRKSGQLKLWIFSFWHNYVYWWLIHTYMKGFRFSINTDYICHICPGIILWRAVQWSPVFRMETNKN